VRSPWGRNPGSSARSLSSRRVCRQWGEEGLDLNGVEQEKGSEAVEREEWNGRNAIIIIIII
jgi:hypothetical protein